MAKTKKENKITKNEQQLLDGLTLVKSHPLFGKLYIRTDMVPKSRLGKSIPAKVSSSGWIYLNKDCDRQPAEWAYIIAHCMLHLSFGHFDAERMPGYMQQISEKQQKWVNQYDPNLWNMACDIFIARFLADIKFGRSDIDATRLAVYGSGADELKIYNYLESNHVPGFAADIPLRKEHLYHRICLCSRGVRPFGHRYGGQYVGRSQQTQIGHAKSSRLVRQPLSASWRTCDRIQSSEHRRQRRPRRY